MAKYCEICKKKIGLFKETYSVPPFKLLCFECYEKENPKFQEKLRIQAEKNRIQIEEEQKKKLREENIKNEELKIDFEHYFYSVSLLYKLLNMKSEAFQVNLKIKHDINLFHTLILEMHNKSNKTKSLDELKQSLCNFSYIGSQINKYIYVNSEIVSKLINRNAGKLYFSIEDQCIYNLLIGNEDNSIEESIDQINRDIDLYDIKAFNYFLGIYTLAYGFVKSLVLSRNFNNFSDNEELFTMFMNLKRETNIADKDIADKLYPIYNSYYKDIFSEIYNKYEFSNFIVLFSKNIFALNRRDINIYKYEIEEFNSKFNKDILEYNQSNYNDIIHEYETLLIKVNNKDYFNWVKTPYDLNYKYIKGAYIMLNEYILLNVGNHIPEHVFFTIFIDKDQKYLRILMKKQEEEVIAGERERLLKGDLSKEKAQELDKLNFNSISTGYEFEQYLKNIFNKLGYESVVTKSSGDQGGDLIIEKDEIKTVVQAKYYSNPVGNKAVQEVVSAIAFYNANKGMVVTNSMFTNAAIELASVNNIELIDGEKLKSIRNEIAEKL